MYAPTFFDSFIFNILIKRHDLSCFSQISVSFLNFCIEITNKILQKLFLFVLRKDVFVEIFLLLIPDVENEI